MSTQNSINKPVPTGSIVGDSDTQLLTNKSIVQSSISTSFESSSRFSATNITFNFHGAVTSVAAPGLATLTWELMDVSTATDNLFLGGSKFSTSVNLDTINFVTGTGQVYIGLGLIANSNTGHTFTTSHAGFKVLLTSGGTLTLYATTADGTTENAVSMGTLNKSNGYTLSVYMVCNSSGTTLSSINFYYKMGNGSWSTATTISSNLPVNAISTNLGQAQFSENATGTPGTSTVAFLGASYIR